MCVCVCVCSKLGSESYVSTYVVLITFERSCCHGGKCLYTYKQDTHGHILFFLMYLWTLHVKCMFMMSRSTHLLGQT